jgi:hypothetical protein
VARSFRTQQPEAAANRRLRRDADGAIELPRVVWRRPRSGDRHPLSAAVIRKIMERDVPVAYLNGLARIELRPRPANVGAPFGCYLPDERMIILYSLPLEWTWVGWPSRSTVKSMLRFYADITDTETGVHVSWPVAEVQSLWFFVEVLAHELGHHYQRQYRIRRGSDRARRHEEYVAALHSDRFHESFIGSRLRRSR